MSRHRAIPLLALLALLVTPVRAEPLPGLPLLRIDTGRHTAFVHALALDETAGHVFSASEDKTVRVWRLSDGRLLDTFRIPIDARADGQLYALALSPDRRLLAVGGWTCWDSERRACVYLLDSSSGDILGRIRGLPEIVAALRFSPDGRFLAVGLMGGAGLRVYRVADRMLIASDAAYRDKLLELDFLSNGRLVTSSLDGFVRLYSAAFVLLGRSNAGLAGAQPFGLRCSPNDHLIAVGFNDVPRVSLLRAEDLIPARTLVTGAAAPPRNLIRLAWAADGSTLYATGETAGQSPAAVFRWRVDGPDTAASAFPTRGRIGDLAVTRGGFVLFASDEPSIGLMDPMGRLRYRWLSGVPDYARSAAEFRVARDGSDIEIAFDTEAESGTRLTERERFSVRRAALTRVTAPSADLAPPITRASGWSLTRPSPGVLELNGQHVALEPYEDAHVFCIAPAASVLLLGTEWSLRAFARNGEPLWSVRVPTAVRAVNASADGRFALAALADGTIEWYALRDGALLLSLFLHADGENWVAWSPNGDYASSPYGDTFVGWQINRGPDRAPDFFRAVQFEHELYRPDLIAARLDTATATTTAPADSSQAGARLLAIAPPRVAATVIEPSGPGASARLRVRIRAESTGLPLHDVAIYVNDIPITPSAERLVRTNESVRLEREVDVPLSEPEGLLRVEVFNGRSLGVTERLVTRPSGAAPVLAERGDLYVLAVGANAFPALDPSLYLSYAASDARDFAQAFLARARSYRHVHVQVLADGGAPASRAAVLQALGALRQARGADTVVVFLASHGVSDARGNYYFVPRDARRADIDALIKGMVLPEENSSLISWIAFFETLRNTAGRRLLVVDTCQARDISGHVQEFSLLKRSASSRIAFILASKGDEESQEYAPARHGLFTYALLQGLSGSADRDRDGSTTLSEWFDFAATLVDRLRDRRIGPQTPQFIAPAALGRMAIAFSGDGR